MRVKLKELLFWTILLIAVIFLLRMPKFPRSKAVFQDAFIGDSIQRPRRNASTATQLPLIVRGMPDQHIANFDHSVQFQAGENGRGVVFVGDEEKQGKKYMSEYHINVLASDVIPLNRRVPDSRHTGCKNLTYSLEGLPDVTVIVPFYNEWLSLLLRTVYSIINRTPPSLLKEIVLVDDRSTFENLQEPLDKYVKEHFPNDLVRILRMPTRGGLIQARMAGWRAAKGEVLVILDSHMEMNIDWLQPLLIEIKKNKKTIAMSVLDNIDPFTLKYDIRPNYVTRYGFTWLLNFYEVDFRADQIGPEFHSPRRGVVTVGTAFAVDRQYFTDIGAYDEGMKIWGGENLELSWKVWMCGGQLLHVPCSHMGHIARFQPYTFPGGRRAIEMYNYKRAVDVWMGPLKKYVYQSMPDIISVDAGDISDRLKLKESLQCNDFTWYIKTIWPELLMYDIDVIAWGSAKNRYTNTCLDNYQHFCKASGQMDLAGCHYGLYTQGFSLTKDGYLRTTFSHVEFHGVQAGGQPTLEPYRVDKHSCTWTHKPNKSIVHDRSKLCLDAVEGSLTMAVCVTDRLSQMWTFNHYV